MDYLGDTNVLLRRIQRVHPEYRVVREAINRLQARGDQLCLVPQNLIEMWAVCTRPVEIQKAEGRRQLCCYAPTLKNVGLK